MRMSFADADVNTDKHTIERTHTNTHTLFSILSLSLTLSLSLPSWTLMTTFWCFSRIGGLKKLIYNYLISLVLLMNKKNRYVICKFCFCVFLLERYQKMPHLASSFFFPIINVRFKCLWANFICHKKIICFSNTTLIFLIRKNAVPYNPWLWLWNAFVWSLNIFSASIKCTDFLRVKIDVTFLFCF